MYLFLTVHIYIQLILNIYFINNPATQDTTAIGISCAKARNITYFITFENLMNQLKAAHHENRLESRLKFFAKYKRRNWIYAD